MNRPVEEEGVHSYIEKVLTNDLRNDPANFISIVIEGVFKKEDLILKKLKNAKGDEYYAIDIDAHIKAGQKPWLISGSHRHAAWQLIKVQVPSGLMVPKQPLGNLEEYPCLVASASK